jgi:hypothetical protein
VVEFNSFLSPPPSVLAEGHSRETSRVIRGRPYRCQVTAQVVESGSQFYREGVRARCGHRLGGRSPARVGSGRGAVAGLQVVAFMSTPLVPPALSAAGREMAREEAATPMTVDPCCEPSTALLRRRKGAE